MATTKDSRTALESARASLEGAAGMVADAISKVTEAERAAEEAGPEGVLATRQVLRNARAKLEDLQALEGAWRTKVTALEEQDRIAKATARLAGLTKAADPKPLVAAHQAAAKKLLPLVREISTTLEALQLDSARQHLAANEAEALSQELGEAVTIPRISADHVLGALAYDGLFAGISSVRVTMPKNQKELLSRVLATTGFGGYVHEVQDAAKAGGLEDDQKIIEAALDGTLGDVIRRGRETIAREAADEQAAKVAAAEAAKVARVAAAERYEAIADKFPWGNPTAATREQAKELEAAELAHFGERQAGLFKKRRQQEHQQASVEE